MVKGKKVSNVIYALPILFSWIGGVIGYFIARSQGDQEKANKIFLLGIGVTIVVVAIRFLQVGGFDDVIASPLSLLT